MKIRNVIATSVIAAIATLSIATPAAASDPTCANGDFCTYEHINYTGSRWTWLTNDSNYTNDLHNGVVANNNVSSARNQGINDPNGFNYVMLYRDAGYSNPILCFPLGSVAPDFTVYGFNDVASSHRWTTSCQW